MKKNSLFLLPVLALASLCVQAQTAPAAPAAAASAPDPTFLSSITGNINVTTNYKFRGQDQGTGKGFSPAVQGGFDWSGLGGFYVGNWNSNVSFAGNIEMDFYGGYKGEIVKDVGYDVGILEYYYPKRDGEVNPNTLEIYGAVSWQWLSLKYSSTVSRDYFGIGKAQQLTAFDNGSSLSSKGRGTGYLDLSGNYPLADKLTLNAHVGYTHLASDLRDASYANVCDIDVARRPHTAADAGCGTTNVGLPSFVDWKVGVTYDLGSGFSAAAAVAGASLQDSYGVANKPRAILTFSKTL